MSSVTRFIRMTNCPGTADAFDRVLHIDVLSSTLVRSRLWPFTETARGGSVSAVSGVILL
jgi:hypothetical protein